MAIFETFSKRKKRLAMAGQQDVFQYDELPLPFRRQVFHIWQNALGRYYVPRGYSTGHSYATNEYWDLIHDTIATEAGLFHLGSSDLEKNERCFAYMLSAPTDDALSIIELSIRVIDRMVRDNYNYLPPECGVTQHPDDAIEELNHRFKEQAIGYQYVDGILMRIDSQFLHAEIVKPAIALLSAKGFEGPADEFIQAFDHYRHGRNKEAVAEALKSFESTMKSICAAQNWKHSTTATAKQLMDVIFDKGLVPAMLEAHFSSLRAAMESGLPTLRNKTSGHGQGPSPVELPNHFAAYALHLTAANIVFLLEAHKALK